MQLVQWPLMGGCYIWYNDEGAGWGAQTAQDPPRCTKCNSHSSTTSVPITVLQYNGPLLCSFNVPIKGLIVLTYSYSYYCICWICSAVLLHVTFSVIFISYFYSLVLFLIFLIFFANIFNGE